MNNHLYGLFSNDRSTRSFLITGFFSFALLCVTAFVAYFETRTLNGINLWIKPLKFDLAIIIHSFTLAILAQQLSEKTRAGLIMGIASAFYVGSAVLENVYISVQAMRGRHSHYNFETPVESLLYAAMGIGALLLVLVPMLMGILLWRQRLENTTGSAYRFATIIGLIIGPILTIIFAGYMSMSGSHFVAAPNASDAGGLPVVGWSTQVADLRPAHFFALHMIQIVPLAGWLSDRILPGISRVVVIVVALINVAIASLLFLNALNGHPLPFLSGFL